MSTTQPGTIARGALAVLLLSLLPGLATTQDSPRVDHRRYLVPLFDQSWCSAPTHRAASEFTFSSIAPASRR